MDTGGMQEKTPAPITTGTLRDCPIYYLNGSKVADDYEDFYDDSWDTTTAAKDTAGNPVSSNEKFFTGTQDNGHYKRVRFSSTSGNTYGAHQVLGTKSVIVGWPAQGLAEFLRNQNGENFCTRERCCLNTSDKYPQPLRRISYRDPQRDKKLVFLTNDIELPALTITELYRSR